MNFITALPEHLHERIEVAGSSSIKQRSFVLYWMRTAIRGHENPALDTAISIANRMGSTVLVYQGLSENYPYASDRHHRFIMEGAIDVAKELRAKGVRYAFHLERPGHRHPVLKQLGNQASLVVTEHFPTPPMRAWTVSLGNSINTPIWQVDTSCLVPMSKSHGRPTRAFKFRQDHQEEREERLLRSWLESIPEQPPLDSTLPFDPIAMDSISENEIDQLISTCAIDHSIPPINDTRGGSIAGYERWRIFQRKNLLTYHRRRNNPLADGCSRMSAYLHYGNVSPFRIAREAARRGPGGQKYLDELLIWRELAYHWCAFTKNPHSLDVLPQWAQRTLNQERTSPRYKSYTWETLSRGKTEDPFWNACQQSLLRQGELHNNLRMTWGKQLLEWTDSPEQCLRYLIDLNHRYALDGRDPSSYGGLLWCLGLFDSPKKPRRAIWGSVRTRTCDWHSRKVDTEKLEEHSSRARAAATPSIAIIGAGIAGLTCAQILQDQGLNVTVFDKARGPGGRSSTRISRHEPSWIFDHGAPAFCATDKRFRLRLLAWQQAGVVDQWRPLSARWIEQQLIENEQSQSLWVGAPKMSSIAEHLATGLDLKTQTQISEMHRDRRWNLFCDAESIGSFDQVVLTCPIPQSRKILPLHLRELLPKIQPLPQWALLLEFTRAIDFQWDQVQFNHPVLSTLTREASKPRRIPGHRWTVLTTTNWAESHLELSREEASRQILHALREAIVDLPTVLQSQCHRWRFSRTVPLRAPEQALHLPQSRLTLAGAALATGDIEGAWCSGAAAAGFILRATKDPAQLSFLEI